MASSFLANSFSQKTDRQGVEADPFPLGCGGEFGVKVILSNRSSIFGEYNLLYTQHNFEILDLDYSMSSWLPTIMAGIAAYF